MKGLDHSVKAFTLLEITIAMLLVAVLSGFAYFALRTFTQVAQTQQVKKRDKYAFELLMSQLSTDWDKADNIAYQSNQLLFLDSVGTIQYNLEDSLILRHQYDLKTDSFFLEINTIEMEILQVADFQTELLQRFNALIKFENKEIPLALQKTYSAKQIIESTNATPHDTD